MKKLTIFVSMLALMFGPLGNESHAIEPLSLKPNAIFGAPITSLAFSPDGQQLLVAYGPRIAICQWPSLSIERTLTLDIPQTLQLQTISSNQSFLASGGSPGQSGSLVQISWPNGEITKLDVSHSDTITASTVSPDGKYLATGSVDKRIVISKLDDRSIRILEGHSKAVTGLIWLGNDMLVSCGEDANVRVWNIVDGKQVRAIEQHTSAINAMASLAPGPSINLRQVVTVGDDKSIRFWQPAIGRMMRFRRIETTPLSVIYSGRDAIVVVGDTSGIVAWIDGQTTETTRSIQVSNDWIQSLILSPDTKKVVIGDNSGQLYVVANDQ